MKTTKPRKLAPLTGYIPCGCRDCFEIAIGAPGALCHACQDAGCDGGECQAPGAYGGDEDAEEAELAERLEADRQAGLDEQFANMERRLFPLGRK